LKNFWNFKTVPVENSEKGESEHILVIDGPIAEDSWWGDEVTPELFKKELKAVKGDLTVFINSPGGDCVAGSRIYTMLKEHKGTITVKIDGIAASAASVIAMAGDKILMAPTAMMMIHNPATMAWGESSDLQRAIEMLNEFKEAIINAYELKSGMSRDELSKLMDSETWMNPKKAIELGFCDGMLFGDIENSGSAYVFNSGKYIDQIVAKMKADSKPKKKTVIEQRLDLYNKLF
jgi:ATP-dependent Clp protease protease subunit